MNRLSSSLRLAACAIVFVGAGCMSTGQRQMRSSTLDFLYPQEAPPATPAQDVRLRLPARVGIAFAPPPKQQYRALSASVRHELLERVAASFRSQRLIGTVEVVPASYLNPGGGFQNVDRVAKAFGFDVFVLVSYDQVQVSETTTASLAYWTLIGAYFIPAERSETHTLLEAVVYDVSSRVLLFHAAGSSDGREWSTPVTLERERREASDEGFNHATDELIKSIDGALGGFARQADTGTVRGRGTPGISFVDDQGKSVKAGGAFSGAMPLLLAGILAWAGRRRRNRRLS